MTLRIFIVSILVLIIVMSMPLLADSDKTKIATAKSDPHIEQSANKHSLWVVESAQNRTYLLGSVHVLRDQDYPLPEVFYEAYDDAEQLVMEINFNAVDPIRIFTETRKAAMLPDGVTLESVIGRSQYAKARKLADQSSISLSMFDRVEPWFAAMTISQVQLQRLGFKSDQGIEMHFLKKALADGKPGAGLETAEEQFGYLDNLTMPTQIKMFLESLTSSEELIKDGEEMLSAWKNGNSVQLNALFAKEFDDNPELEKTLLIERNNRWMPKIISYTKENDDYLVIVGALHLVGEHGLIRLLREKGFEVRQL